MYFNPQVKSDRKNFFNFESLQAELKEALRDKNVPLIAVHGLRRTGKTSLIRVVFNSIGKKYVWIDGREIGSRGDFYNRISEEVRKMKRLRLAGVSIKGIEFALGRAEEGLDYMNRKRVSLVVDEAQLLGKFRLDGALASIYDNHPAIKLVLSGSETGMLMQFLGKENAKAPLYGRAICEIKTRRLTKEDARRFLTLGARQAKLEFRDDEIIGAIGSLDGIIGWLTKYGWYRLKHSPREALRRTLDEGKIIAKDEFSKFASRAGERYLTIARSIKGGARWEEIRRSVGISDKQLYTMLSRLIGGGFVEKKDGVYTLADPMLEAAV